MTSAEQVESKREISDIDRREGILSQIVEEFSRGIGSARRAQELAINLAESCQEVNSNNAHIDGLEEYCGQKATDWANVIVVLSSEDRDMNPARTEIIKLAQSKITPESRLNGEVGWALVNLALSLRE